MCQNASCTYDMTDFWRLSLRLLRALLECRSRQTLKRRLSHEAWRWNLQRREIIDCSALQPSLGVSLFRDRTGSRNPWNCKSLVGLLAALVVERGQYKNGTLGDQLEVLFRHIYLRGENGRPGPKPMPIIPCLLSPRDGHLASLTPAPPHALARPLPIGGGV